MSNKKILLKKLLDYPNLNNNEYILLLNKKNNLIKNNINNNEINEINSILDIYKEKELIINMIKSPYIYR